MIKKNGIIWFPDICFNALFLSVSYGVSGGNRRIQRCSIYLLTMKIVVWRWTPALWSLGKADTGQQLSASLGPCEYLWVRLFVHLDCSSKKFIPQNSYFHEVLNEVPDGVNFASQALIGISGAYVMAGPFCHVLTMLGYIKHSRTSWSRGDYPAVFSIGAALPRTLCAGWASQFKDVKDLECVQRATKLVERLEGMSCEEWL